MGCACYAHGTDFSAVEGTGSLGVMLVGEASGEHEQRDQLPFRPYAPAGGVLERTLRRMGVDRQQFSTTNALRCRPRNNWLEGAPWEYSALAQCRPNLDAAIASRRPRAMVALGGTATRELTGMAGEARGVTHLAGYVLPLARKIPEACDCGGKDEHCFLCGGSGISGERIAGDATSIPVIPDFHPAFLRRGKASYTGVFSRILQRAVNVAAGKDRQWMWNVDPEDRSTHGSLTYTGSPSLDVARAYYNRLRDGASPALIYDLETSESASLDEDAREGFADTHVRLIQFCAEAGNAIALPWEGEYRHIAQAILALPILKAGHNVWTFDNKVLRAAGEREGLDLQPRGVIHDTLAMFHHWQPDLPAHLQFAASFVQFPFPWKHLAATNLPFYGCCDVDSTLRLYTMLEATMKRDGIWQGYVGQVYEVRPVLAAMEDRGLPVDDEARLALDAEFDTAQRELTAELDKEYPDAIRSVTPKQGYKRTPKNLEGLVSRQFSEAALDGEGNPVSVVLERWCRAEAFSPNSGPQLIRYMKHHGHPVPKSRKENEDGEAKDTTDKKELVRLAKKVGDSFYLRVIECRELSKARGTYVDGFRPGGDGRVHTTFTFATGTGQLSSRNPNVQNFPKHGRLADPLRRMIAAPPGHVIVEVDKKSFHVLTTGFCAEDPEYMRMARLDMHSFVAGHFLKCWDADKIRGESDAQLLDRFQWFKADPQRKRVRDKQAKPSILGVGFGMGARRLYQENLEHFPDERTAKRFLNLLQALFPRVFAWQDRIRREAHERQQLLSPFGHIRRFYEVYRWDSRKGGYANGDQAEEAVAFLPANLAFGEMRECMKEQRRLGLDERYGLCNSIHDSFVYVFPEDQLDAFIAEAIPVLTAPSKVLRHPVLAPGGLVVDVEASVGPDWSNMQNLELKVKEAA